MTAPAVLHAAFDPATLAGVDEPVRRFFTHALAPGTETGHAVRIEMAGRIRVGRWLAFRAVWQGDARSFVWRASAGPRGVVRAVDHVAAGRGGMDVELFGRVPLVRSSGPDTVRSAAGRAAIEGALWAPGAVLPDHDATWRAEADDIIVGTWEVEPEQPEVRLRIAPDGAVCNVSVPRWRGGRYVVCGGEVLGERRFGDLTLPSVVSVGWDWGTAAFRPFFEAEVLSAAPAA